MSIEHLINHEDTIALLYIDESSGNDARDCLNLPQNDHLIVTQRVLRQDAEQRRTARGQTPLDDTYSSSFQNGRYLWLRFSQPPKSRMGIVAGCNPRSDIAMPQSNSRISWYHFALQFDSNYKLIIADLDSTCGTVVRYDNHNPGPRRNGRWIIGGDAFLSDVSTITVEAHNARFEVIVPQRDAASRTYQAQVDRFKRSVALDPNFADLELSRSRPDTRRPTGTHTPSTAPIHIKQELGRGSFGVVCKVWDATTGQQWAEKSALGNRFSQSTWKKEIDIMRGLRHDHIVRLLEGGLSPRPWIRLEYLPEGSLKDHRDRGNPHYSRAECLHILHQGLSVLKYLHAQQPPVVHRDIAPKNILLQSRRPIHIKFADFGLSKQSDDLKTMCGTRLYIAPEIHGNSNRSRGYTPAVDVWSLGVVIVHLLYGLPTFKREYSERPGLWWAQIHFYLDSQAKKYDDSFAYYLRNYMLPVEASERATAAECFDWSQAVVQSMEPQVSSHHMTTRSGTRRQGSADASKAVPPSSWHAQPQRQSSGSGSKTKSGDDFSFGDWINWPTSQESREGVGRRR